MLRGVFEGALAFFKGFPIGVGNDAGMTGAGTGLTGAVIAGTTGGSTAGAVIAGGTGNLILQVWERWTRAS